MAAQAKRDGFTLVEVMVAAVIFAAVFSGISIGVSAGFNLLDNARDQTRVSQLLQSEMESLRTMSWADLAKLPAKEAVSPDVQFSADQFTHYSMERVVAAIGSNQKQITVTATWNDRRGRAKSRIYMTIFTQQGLNDYFYRIL